MAQGRDKNRKRNRKPAVDNTPLRMCVGSRDRKHPRDLIRLVVTPPSMNDLGVDGANVPEGKCALMLDFSGRAPGRGAYLSPDPSCVQRALRKGGLRRALGPEVHLPEADVLMNAMREGLEKIFLQRLSLARRANAITSGAGKVSTSLKQGQGSFLILAGDLSEGGRRKQEMNARRKELPFVVSTMDGATLGQQIGREYAGLILILEQQFAQDLNRLGSQIDKLRISEQESH